MILEKEDKTNQLVYFGKYTSKKNKAELKNEKKLSKKDYKENWMSFSCILRNQK